MNLDLTALGFTQEELQQRVIDQITERVLVGVYFDEEGGEVRRESSFARALDAQIKKRIDDTINALAEKYVLPNVSSYIENLTLQQTTAWGEKVGKPVTFIEYLTNRAEDYMQEKVDFQGKTKGEAGGFSWNGTQTRITYLIHQHLHYTIDAAMKNALSIATSEISKGIQETAKIKLGELASSLKVTVQTK